RKFFGQSSGRPSLPQMQKPRLSKFDMLATLTEFTARSMGFSYLPHVRPSPESIILTGGGAANRTLVELIRRGMRAISPAIKVMSCDSLGWPLQSIEPAAFALLAWLRVHGRPGNLPETTGASRPVVLGQISEP